jgi:hypothetical protein
VLPVLSNRWIGFFSLQSLIINSDGQSAAGYNRPFSNLAAWRFCFLGQPQRTMERISSALHFLGSDSGDRDQRDIVDHERFKRLSHFAFGNDGCLILSVRPYSPLKCSEVLIAIKWITGLK